MRSAVAPKPRSKARDADLSGVVIAFDLDNTLLDPSGVAYRNTVTEFLDHPGLGLSAEEALTEYEALRVKGEALERLGLRNANHDRGNADALSVLCLTCDVGSEPLRALDVSGQHTASYHLFLNRLAELDLSTRQGNLEERLEAELAVRRFCATDGRSADFRAQVARFSSHPMIAQWTNRYRTIEQRQSVEDVRPVLHDLVSRGAVVVIITEGKVATQKEKVKHIGLAEVFDGRVLVSEAAATFPGVSEFRIHLEGRLHECAQSAGRIVSDELLALWQNHCVLDALSRKTPAFFARCLHAICRNPDGCERELANVTIVSEEDWRRQPLRFVMIGDRYESDVLPLIQLLGPRVGLRIRITEGKYAGSHRNEDLLRDQRPDLTFNTWVSLACYLADDLTADSISPIESASDVFFSMAHHHISDSATVVTNGTGLPLSMNGRRDFP